MNESQAKALGAMLRERRNALGLSTYAVKDATGIPSTTISRIETGSFKAPRPEPAWDPRRLHTLEARMESWQRSAPQQRGTRLS